MRSRTYHSLVPHLGVGASAPYASFEEETDHVASSRNSPFHIHVFHILRVVFNSSLASHAQALALPQLPWRCPLYDCQRLVVLRRLGQHPGCELARYRDSVARLDSEQLGRASEHNRCGSRGSAQAASSGGAQRTCPRVADPLPEPQRARVGEAVTLARAARAFAAAADEGFMEAEAESRWSRTGRAR